MILIPEAVLIMGRILDGMLAAGRASVAGRANADLRRAVGDLRVSIVTHLRGGSLGAPLLNCFVLVGLSGADLVRLRGLRDVILAESPVTLPGIALVQACLRFVLAQEARVIANTEYKSRDKIDALIVVMNEAFEVAEMDAADQEDSDGYRRLVTMHAAVTRHLSSRARPLPHMVRYSYPSRRPALMIANVLYGDAERFSEIIDENRVVHPAFCPSQGRALTR